MEEIQVLNNAFKIYNLNNEPDLSNRILDYILTRLLDNELLINRIIDNLNEPYKYKDLLDAFKKAYQEEDFYKVQDSIVQGVDYYSGSYPVPIGNIAIETNNPIDVIKYFVRGIKSRNTITISQTEYNENSLSNMIYIIFSEAIRKFGLDKNTLRILPFEDCFYEMFDEVLEIEDDKEVLKQKPFTNQYIIYDNDKSFTDEIEKEKERLGNIGFSFEVIDGDFDEAVKTINKIRPYGATIYTKNKEDAYQFINLIHSPNVFFNASLTNAEKQADKKNKLYYIKKVMYPSGEDFNLENYLKEF